MADQTNKQAPDNPVSNLLFDWISVLHNRAEGLSALDQYIADAEERDADKCLALFKKLRTQDVAALQEIKDHVAFMMNKDQAYPGALDKMRRDSEAPAH